jgi:hypothetical protein
MTATHRLKGMGWFLLVVIGALGCYLMSLQVATERKKLEDLNHDIAEAHRDIRALQTEFTTRANLAQLERWNGDVLALTAPTPAQFISSEAELAALDFNGPAGPEVQTAALVIPSAPPLEGRAPEPVEQTPAPVMMAAAAPVPVAPVRAHAKEKKEPVRVAAAEPTPKVKAKPKAEAMAMLDRTLLSDATLGDLLAGARAERRGR